MKSPLLTTLAIAAVPLASALPRTDDPAKTIDLATVVAGVDPLFRVSGFGNDQGLRGVPVGAAGDIDGDGFADFAVGHFLSSPMGRNGAGEVNVVFGDGSTSGTVDLALADPRVLRIIGAGNLGAEEATGSEIWLGDVTGDGLVDILICRQNYTFDPGTGTRCGAGALTIIAGHAQLETMAAANQVFDLASPPAGISMFDVLGPHANARMGIWARVGDVDGDGILDIICAADQEDVGPANQAGAVYVVRGGAHLDQTATVDLASFGSTLLAGNLARIVPPAGSGGFHLGSTNQAGDLDANGRAEVLLSAALNRSGAAVGPGCGGMTDPIGGASPSGWAFVVWDDNFPVAPWPAGHLIDLQGPPGSMTVIRGGAQNDTFGEELLGGRDFDGDGDAELFVGDLTGDGTGGMRPQSGVGYVFYAARNLRGLDFNVDDATSMGIPFTKILGPSPGAIAGDTVAEGDFDGDGVDDLMIGSPTDNPLGRAAAGTMHVFFGKQGGWPALVDTAPGAFPHISVARITEVFGALGGAGGGDTGDTLCYSAAANDIDGDGRDDLVVNEMRGNGTSPGTIDAGNLIILDGGFVEAIDEWVTITVNGPPATLHPAGGSVGVTIVEGHVGDLMAGTEMLTYDAGAGPVQSPLAAMGGGSYAAVFPAFACGTAVTWSVSAETVSGLSYASSEYETVFALGIANLASDDMEATGGWTVGFPGDTATTGIWERGDPVGTAAQPEDDHTPSPGTDCWFTGQGTPGGPVGQNDVDGGATTLVSPVFDLTGTSDPTIGYWRWYSNDQGGGSGSDVFEVFITDDGVNWEAVEVVGPTGPGTSGGWMQYSFRVLGIANIALTNQIQLRFVASDVGQGSIVEAAIDDLSIDDVQCDIGTSFCTVVPTSLGTEARLNAIGDDAVASNDVTLLATLIPPDQFGYFLVSEFQGMQTPPGSWATCCLGSPFAGYVQQIHDSGAQGALSQSVDLTALPLSPPQAVQPGETWHFQAWFRDTAVTTTSNFTNAYTIVFQ